MLADKQLRFATLAWLLAASPLLAQAPRVPAAQPPAAAAPAVSEPAVAEPAPAPAPDAKPPATRKSEQAAKAPKKSSTPKPTPDDLPSKYWRQKTWSSVLLTLAPGIILLDKAGLEADFVPWRYLSVGVEAITSSMDFEYAGIQFGSFRESVVTINARIYPFTNTFNVLAGYGQRYYTLELGQGAADGMLTPGWSAALGSEARIEVDNEVLELGFGNRGQFREPPNTIGQFLLGNAALIPPMPLHDGFLNITSTAGTSILRFPGISTGTGAVDYSVDFTLPPAASAVLIDSRLYFQFWYRDVGFGPSGSNLSNGLSVGFVN